MKTLLNMLILSVVVFGVAKLLPGIRIKGFVTAAIVAVVMTAINWLVYTLFFFVAVPFVILTGFLGLLILNIAVLWITDKLIEDFEIQGLGTTAIASLLISISSALLRWMLL